MPMADLALNYLSGTYTLITYSEFWVKIFLDPLPDVIIAIFYNNTVLNTRCG